MPMTPQQRSAAAFKAAATRRAKLAAQRAGNGGFAPPPRPRRSWTPPPTTAVPPPTPPPAPAWTPPGKAFATPTPTVESQRATVLVALEDLYALVIKATGKTPEREKAFETYRKVLNRALAPATTRELKNEAETALRTAALSMVRLTF